MNKLILKLGWPGALLLLVGALSLGVYTIINQSILDEEKKEITEDIIFSSFGLSWTGFNV